MKVEDIAEKINGNILCGQSGGEEITSVYAGDFLSRVMGKAKGGSVWLTVMANVNVAGVAVLADIKAIVLCEGVQPDKLLLSKCQDEDIALITTDLPVYECCKIL